MFRIPIVIIFVVVIFVFSVQAQSNKATGFVGTEVGVKSGVVKPQVNGLIEKPLTKKVKAFAFGLAAKDYYEFYSGVAYSPKPWVEVAAGAGLEDNRLRLGGWVWDIF
jgi:hypothetical protein